MTVTDYVILGRAAHHSYLGAETSRDRRAAAEALERLELSPFSRRPLARLSGGESQRVVLARALAQEAPVLVLDEPTSSLDLGHGQKVMELADELRRERGICVVCAIHDLTLSGQYADSLMVLFEGRSTLFGAPADVLTEGNVSRFFGASVQVALGPSGPAVTPVRRAAPAGWGPGAPVAQVPTRRP